MLFTDDDTVPPLDWVANLVRWFDNPEVGAVGGPNFAPDDDPFGAKCADVAVLHQVHDRWHPLRCPTQRRTPSHLRTIQV